MRRHKIDIMDLTVTKDADGYAINTWQELTASPLWADITDQSSREFYAANAEMREHIIRCNISFRNDVDETMRIKWNDKYYEIIRIYNGKYKRNSIDIDARSING